MLETIVSDPTLLALLIGLVPPALMLLGAWIVSLLSRRAKLTPEQLKLIREFVQMAIEYAEEWAVNKLKETGQKPLGLQKSAVAVKATKTLAGPKLAKKLSDDGLAVAVQAGMPEARRRGSVPPSPLPPLK